MIDFKNTFVHEISKLYPNGLEWGLVGILTKDQRVYTLSYDSKILSGIFEIFCEPIVKLIANNNGMKLEKSPQNAYPDFTLFLPNHPKEKLAIEVKSTYRQYTKAGKVKKFGFTLGSYRSYLRDPEGKKGILYPYEDYSEHWVIGFLYDRNPNCDITEIRQVIEASQLQTPYTNIDYFVQEKHKIAGKTPGSGNTTNIGSIRSNNLSDFKNGESGFNTIEEFEDYWKNYKK